jgi:predicted nucleic acid-binding protein
MTHTVLADSGPLYAAADESDAHHARALRELQKLARDRREVAVACPTLLEAYSLILRRMGMNAGYKWLAYMSDVTLVNPTPEDYRHSIARVRALPDQHITLFDATVAELALRLNLEVWTYDHHFDVMGVRVWR